MQRLKNKAISLEDGKVFEQFCTFLQEHLLNKETFSVKEAADYLKTTPGSIESYAKKRMIRYSSVGNRKVFRKSDLDEFLESRSKDIIGY